jgi:antitoxin VapB
LPVDTGVYTDRMILRAKLFRNGGSQAVRLPKACRFPDEATEVLVRQEGRRIVLEPADNGWPPEFLAVLGAWKKPIPLPRHRRTMKHRNPFA